MRAVAKLWVLALAVGVISCRHTDPDAAATGVDPQSGPASTPQVMASETAPAAADALPPAPVREEHVRVDFNRDVKPILEARCQPCHFPGGIMYERRPFDRPETITALGTKLFTRIKDEDEQRLISEFLAQQSP